MGMNCIFHHKQGNLETCVILNYCNGKDECKFRIEQFETHKPTEEELIEIFKEDEE